MTQSQKDIIPLTVARTLDGLFRERVRRSPSAVAYRGFDKRAGGWIASTWEEMDAEVRRWMAALTRENLSTGERVAIVMRNCREWVAFDQAALALGLVVVPLYTDDRPDNMAYILNDCAARLVLIHEMSHWKRLQAMVAGVPSLQRIVLGGEDAGTDLGDARATTIAAWLGRNEPQTQPAPANGRAGERANDPQQLASIVYTSGTTGRPKGVMLSHHNMLSNAHAVLSIIDVFQTDVFISLLPLSHTLERTANYYMVIMAGATVAYARSVNQLGEDLQALQPTAMICVPRVLERFQSRIETQMAKQPWWVQRLFSMTVRGGWNHFESGQGRATRTPLGLLWPTLQRRVAGKLLAQLGGRLRLAICGGAALPLPVARLFIGLGLPVLQGYGLTETSPVISVNTPENNDPASVGVLLPGVEARIGQQDELLVRGPGVMMAYWNNHGATLERIDPDGWLHTGDQARLDDGHVVITGRIKDILVLSNGEKVPPGDMEMAICADPLFEQALVVGEGQAYLAALLVLNAEHWAQFSAELGLDPKAPASLEEARVQTQIVRRVAKWLHAFPGYAKIRRVALSCEPWSVENGLLTPTLKVRRNKVMEHYRGQLAGLFNDVSPSA